MKTPSVLFHDAKNAAQAVLRHTETMIIIHVGEQIYGTSAVTLRPVTAIIHYGQAVREKIVGIQALDAKGTVLPELADNADAIYEEAEIGTIDPYIGDIHPRTPQIPSREQVEALQTHLTLILHEIGHS